MALADYLRGNEDVALVAPFGQAMTEAEWATEYQPYEDLIVAHQPLSAWARHDTSPPLSVGAHLGSGANLHTASAGVESPDLARIERAASSETHTVLPLYLMRPRLDKAATAEMEAALTKLKASGEIDGYVWTRSLPMPHLTEQVEVLLLLPVGATVDKTLFPKYAD